jgi:hypothetical protein
LHFLPITFVITSTPKVGAQKNAPDHFGGVRGNRLRTLF